MVFNRIFFLRFGWGATRLHFAKGLTNYVADLVKSYVLYINNLDSRKSELLGLKGIKHEDQETVAS